MSLHFPRVNATFIHIPKNAGNSLEKWAVDHTIAFEEKGNHCTLPEARQLWPNLGTTFSFVRNPFSRVVSMYHYLGQHAERSVLEKRSFDIVDDLKTIAMYKRGFDYWLNCLYDVGSEFNEHGRIETINGRSFWPRRAPQTIWFDGDAIDVVFKIENLDTELVKVGEILGCSSTTPLDWVNPSKHNHYKEYYNLQNIQIVREMFASDLSAFNYDY